LVSNEQRQLFIVKKKKKQNEHYEAFCNGFWILKNENYKGK
jgi:hypothetical protein